MKVLTYLHFRIDWGVIAIHLRWKFPLLGVSGDHLSAGNNLLLGALLPQPWWFWAEQRFLIPGTDLEGYLVQFVVEVDLFTDIPDPFQALIFLLLKLHERALALLCELIWAPLGISPYTCQFHPGISSHDCWRRILSSECCTSGMASQVTCSAANNWYTESWWYYSNEAYLYYYFTNPTLQAQQLLLVLGAGVQPPGPMRVDPSNGVIIQQFGTQVTLTGSCGNLVGVRISHVAGTQFFCVHSYLKTND